MDGFSKQNAGTLNPEMKETVVDVCIGELTSVLIVKDKDACQN